MPKWSRFPPGRPRGKGKGNQSKRELKLVTLADRAWLGALMGYQSEMAAHLEHRKKLYGLDTAAGAEVAPV